MSTQQVTLPKFLGFAPPATLRWTGFAGAVLLTVAVWTSRYGLVPFAAGIAGVGLVTLAWVLLSRADRTVSWLRGTLALWCAPLLAVPPLFSGDVYSYLAQGAVAANGHDVNAVGPLQGLGPASDILGRVSVYWRETPSPYGPLFGSVERLIAQLSQGNLVAGIALHRFVEIAGLLLIGWAVPRLAAVAGVSPASALWLGVLNPLVLWHVVAGMHNDSLMLGLMAAGTAIALEAVGDRIRWPHLAGGTILIALGAEVKLPALVALAAVGTALARRRARLPDFLLCGAAMLVLFAAVSAVVSLPTGIGFSWISALTTSGQVNSWMAPTNWFGFLIGGIGSLFGAHLTQTMIGVGKIIGYVLSAAGIVVALRWQWTGRIDAVRSLGLMLAALVVFGPAVQPWYLLWAAVPLAASLPAGRARATLISLLAVFSVVLPPIGGNFSGRIGLLVAGYLIGIAVVVLAFFAMRKNQEST
ncbi:polyprenol phosphomannose-dependent alpha 1,6 mannosyltransferase MptB [Amycolatopsis benzoatilytica]|uniref:polyprenol phosphomannose-dependent alpha 1,6 mannosyltransferase MptB n=1 Tax=Amycolatopsis benzoatilytica TaxID=346045 RepID=UPI00037D9ABA|nr:polyprenol phosphomannose-dependent alpha 1,6 mannosyltransferase MptB [Amycolatopsis benzoatilytica]